ncbi:MAG: damage-inducible mutagenesis protein [Rhodospirillales bacterium]|nr:MAG: damage-inducible mutagenesis protein [Rhodospirillales bacterium]
MSRWENLAGLRAAVARIERGAAARATSVLPLGVPAIDAALGEGGLRAGALHEIAGPAADGFVAVLAGRLAARGGGTVLWCPAGEGRGVLHPPGLAMLGLAPERLLLARCRGRAELLAVAEEGLRTAGLAAVVAETAQAPGMAAMRRLQLAAETGGVTGFLLCRGAGRRHGANAPGATAPEAGAEREQSAPGFMPPSPAVSRWQVDPVPGGGRQRWRLTLRRCRGGGTGEWMVDWDEKTHRFAVVLSAGD